MKTTTTRLSPLGIRIIGWAIVTAVAVASCTLIMVPSPFGPGAG